MNNLINEFDEIIRWPKKRLEQNLVVEWLSKKFDSKKIYSEKEINKIIKEFHVFEDIPLLRRELISKKYLARKDDGSEYWKVS
tara:strand:+ start:426 stop:674 length:249 start_codon:yes stop_codon:yes gene_type:complete